ncbi:MAG TPA: caspase family protein [Anaeromyxobacteraceae bacterium]|nr:caspase family protein [Anaeromyxobacteraceae bacterium]
MSSPRHGRWICAALAGLLFSPAASQAEEKGGLVPVDFPSAGVSRALAPKRIALLVGIQQFDDPRWRALRFPQADASALAAVLGDPERGNFDQVEVVAPSATREELRAALRRITARDGDERDTVVVYVSSHGTLARDGRGELHRYLVTRDTRVDAVSETALSLDELRSEFDRLRSRRKVLILAACHSGAGKSLLPPPLESELAGTKAGFFVRPIEEVSRASVVLAASAWGETAREDERLGHDIYTHFLVEALREGADRNGDGATTVTEAHDYARRRTYDYTGGQQRPTAESSEVGVDPVVLTGRVRQRGRPELYSYSSRLDGFTVRVDGKPLTELPGGVALDPGSHRVQVAKGGSAPLLDTEVDLDPGERIDFERLVSRSAGRFELAPRIAAVAFLDRRSRADVLAPVTAVGAALAIREWPTVGMELRVDAATSSGTSHVTISGGPLAVGYDLVAGGLALPWRFRPGWPDRVELFAGPRLSGLWIRRRFELSPSPSVAQTYFTFTPGLVAGLEVQLTRRLSFGAEGHLDWAIVRIDGASRTSGLAEGLAGFGWSF